MKLAILLAQEPSRLEHSKADYKEFFRDSRNLYYEFDLEKVELVIVSEKPARYAGELVIVDGELRQELDSGVVNVICESLPEVAWLEYRDDMDFPYITKRYTRLPKGRL
jgi:hypothetical protein